MKKISKGKAFTTTVGAAAFATPTGLLISKSQEWDGKEADYKLKIEKKDEENTWKGREIESLQNKNKSDISETEGLYETITTQSETIYAQDNEINDLNKENDNLREVIDEQSGTISDLNGRVDNLAEENKVLREKNNLLEREQHHMDEIYSRGLEGQIILEENKEILTREISNLKVRAKDIEDMMRQIESKSKGFILAMLRETNVTDMRSIGIQINKKAQEFANCYNNNCKVDGMNFIEWKKLIDQHKK